MLGYPRTCAEVRGTVRNVSDARPASKAASGVYRLFPLGKGSASYPFYCDLATDGGGWLLTWAYTRSASTSTPALVEVDADSWQNVPLDPDTGYAHFHVEAFYPTSGAYSADASIEAVRFECSTSAHSRLLHFKTSNSAVKEVAYSGSAADVSSDGTDFSEYYTALEGHSANLPGDATDSATGSNSGFSGNGQHSSGNTATGAPFEKTSSATGNTLNAWSIRRVDSSGNVRFECDNAATDPSKYATTHRVWVRLAYGNPSRQPTHLPTHKPSPAPSTLFPPTVAPTYLLSCSRQTCGELGWADSDSDGVCANAQLNVSAAFSAAASKGLACSGKKTWADARDWCEAGGARLCTSDELSRGVAAVAGCGLSQLQVWAATACSGDDDNENTGLMFASGRGDGANSRCYASTAKVYAACCADARADGSASCPTPAPSAPTPVPTPAIECSLSSCATLGWANAGTFGADDVCGASNQPPLPGCSTSKLWSDARDVCKAVGARLCT
jgi:hypothetical protein